MPRSTTCEIPDGEGWKEVSVEGAIGMPRTVEKRCPECHGPVRAHKEGANGASPHIEHRQRHKGCSRGDCFNGHQSPHPHAIE
jgi:hypothetical protein